MEDKFYRINGGITIVTIFCLFILIVIFSYYVLNPGYSAIHMRMGRIVSVNSDSGLYFKIPLVDNIVSMKNGIIKANIETSALSKDLQAISVGIDVNYRYMDILELYKATRGDAEQIILIPFCHESIKAVVARYTAEDLIHFRHDAKDAIFKDLKDRLRPHFIEFIEVNFSHADFSPDFIKSVEDKQIATQEAMMARNVTEKVKEEAIQTRLMADADAYTQQVKKQSTSKELAQLMAIERWDGRLPTYCGGPIPFLGLPREL